VLYNTGSLALALMLTGLSANASANPVYDRFNWSSGQGSAHLLGGVAVIEEGGALRIVVRGNDAFKRVGLMRLKNPQRLIIDLPGVRRPRRVKAVVKAGKLASGVRMSRNGGVLRIVVDLNESAWSHKPPKSLGNGFEVLLRRPKAVAKAPKSVTPAVKLMPINLVDARLVDHGGFVRATLAFDGDARFNRDPNEGSLRALRITNCSMANRLVQGQDLNSVRAPLHSLSTFRDPKSPQQCRVLIDIAQGAEDAVWTQGKQLFWDVRFAPKVAKRVAAEEDDTEVEEAAEEFEDDPASDTGEVEDEEGEDGEEGEFEDDEDDEEGEFEDDEDDEEGEFEDDEDDEEGEEDEEGEFEDDEDEEGEFEDDEDEDEEEGEFEDDEDDEGEFEEEGDDDFTLTADRRITLDTQSADIINVLRLISEVAGINIIASDEVKGKISLRLRNVPWQDALKVVLRVKGLGAVRDSIDTENTTIIPTNREEILKQQAKDRRRLNIIRIDTLENLQAEAKAKADLKKTIEEGVPTKVQMFAINYSTAADLAPHVEKLVGERGRVQVDERTNYLIVEATPSNLFQAEAVIKELDIKTEQVLVEARMVEANTTFVRALGIQWQPTFSMAPATGNATGLPFPNSITGNGGAVDSSGSVAPFATSTPFAVNLPSSLETGAVGLVLGSAGNALTLNLRITAGENNGTAKTISAPRVVTMNHKTASITQGLEMTITEVTAQGPTSQRIQAELRLEVTPHVNADGMIHMVLNIQNNRPDFTRQVRGVPSIETKETRTEVMVRDGETSIIGGIYTRNMARERKEVPGLSKIPLLGYLFRNSFQTDERRELLIFITPRLVDKLRQQAGIVQPQSGQ
jgi:type IV pilus secretin PilQ/predicted competence protein